MDGELNPVTFFLYYPYSKHLEKLMSKYKLKNIYQHNFSKYSYLIIRTFKTPSMAFNFSTTASVTGVSTSIREYA